MLTTIKLKLTEPIPLDGFQRKYANVVRFAFNRGMDGVSKFDIFKLLNNLNNVDELDLSWKREAAKLGYSLAKAALERYKENGIFQMLMNIKSALALTLTSSTTCSVCQTEQPMAMIGS